MNIRDGWATEYSRKSFSVQVDEQDYAKWLDEAGVDAAHVLSIPLQGKFRIMKLMASTWTLADLVHYLDRNGEDYSGVQAELKEANDELTGWKEAVKEKFGA
jgi:hypothetical protein